MTIRLHKNATTTPRIRALIQASDEPQTVLARRFGVSVETVARRKRRDSVEPEAHLRRWSSKSPGTATTSVSGPNNARLRHRWPSKAGTTRSARPPNCGA